MLTDYFKSPLTLERYRLGLVGPLLDAFTAWLDERGYRRVSIRRHVREVVHFAAWAKTTGIPVEGLNKDALDRLHSYLAEREQLRYGNGVATNSSETTIELALVANQRNYVFSPLSLIKRKCWRCERSIHPGIPKQLSDIVNP